MDINSWIWDSNTIGVESRERGFSQLNTPLKFQNLRSLFRISSHLSMVLRENISDPLSKNCLDNYCDSRESFCIGFAFQNNSPVVVRTESLKKSEVTSLIVYRKTSADGDGNNSQTCASGQPPGKPAASQSPLSGWAVLYISHVQDLTLTGTAPF